MNVNSAVYNNLGRVVGGYCYLLLCRDADNIYIKVGRTIDPYGRYRALTNNCPVKAISFSTIALPSNELAKRLEPMIHKALDKWRVKGEWFVFKAADKREFNDQLREAMADFGTMVNGWPMVVTKVPVEEIEKQAALSCHKVQKAYMKAGRSYRDYRSHGGSTLLR